MNLIQEIEKKYKATVPLPETGDKVNVHIRVIEGEKERVQVFQGIVLKTGGSGASRSFTVRKISDGIGIEKTFPLNSPILSKVEVLSQSKVRRAKLYYLRNLKGRASRLASVFTGNASGISSDKAKTAAKPAEKTPSNDASGTATDKAKTAAKPAEKTPSTEPVKH